MKRREGRVEDAIESEGVYAGGIGGSAFDRLVGLVAIMFPLDSVQYGKIASIGYVWYAPAAREKMKRRRRDTRSHSNDKESSVTSAAGGKEGQKGRNVTEMLIKRRGSRSAL